LYQGAGSFCRPTENFCLTPGLNSLDWEKLVIDAAHMAVSRLSGKFTFFKVSAGKYTLSVDLVDNRVTL
jgi:hypothetical protein